MSQAWLQAARLAGEALTTSLRGGRCLSSATALVQRAADAPPSTSAPACRRWAQTAAAPEEALPRSAPSQSTVQAGGGSGSKPPSIATVKSDFTSKIGQITRGNPDNAFSVLPTIVDIVLDCMPKAVHAIAITGIDEESLLASASQEEFAAIRKGALPQADLVFSVDAAQIFSVLKFMCGHAQLQFKCLVEMTAVDYPERTIGRFEVTYVLWSPTLNARIIVKALVGELDAIESVVPIYANANWLERETWDMFGVFFKNHPDLRRLLTDYGFTHHPLRKDFPVQGYTEVFYSESRKAVTTRAVQLAQSQRVVAGDL